MSGISLKQALLVLLFSIRLCASVSNTTGAISSRYGWTDLMSAVSVNDTATAAALIAHGADVNATNAEGYSPLMIAADRGHAASVKLLLGHGADANHEAPHGVTAMRLALNRNEAATAQLILKRTAIRNVPLMEMYPLAAKESASNRRATDGTFSYEMHPPLITLSYGGGRSNESISLSIRPDVGNRIISIMYGTNELLYADTNIAKLYTEGGIPILYPTPDRVKNGTFTFDGRTVVMKHPLTPYPVAQNGIVLDDRWSYSAPEFVPGGVAFKAWYVVDSNNPRFSAFPWVHRLTVTYTLMNDRVLIAYEVKNSDSTRFGFGLGLKPYWRVTGTVRIQADIPSIMDFSKGSAAPVNSSNDIRRPRLLTLSADISGIYYKMTPANSVTIFHDNIGLSMNTAASDAFTHLVLRKHAEKPYFCVSHQTSSPDAHNLYAKGEKVSSHLIIVNPGEAASGSVAYILHRRH